MASDPWYRDGLRFGCTRCGNCCTGQPGTVRVSDAEIGALARHLGLDDAAFRAIYTRELRGGEISLREKSDRACVFYGEGGCGVYSLRPRQCRTWPFWRSVVHSEERWNDEALDCPGMNRGALHPADAIARSAARDGTSGGDTAGEDVRPGPRPAESR